MWASGLCVIGWKSCISFNFCRLNSFSHNLGPIFMSIPVRAFHCIGDSFLQQVRVLKGSLDHVRRWRRRRVGVTSEDAMMRRWRRRRRRWRRLERGSAAPSRRRGRRGRCGGGEYGGRGGLHESRLESSSALEVDHLREERELGCELELRVGSNQLCWGN